MAISYRGIAIEIRKHTDPRNGLSRGEYRFKCQGVARQATSMRATVSQIDELLDDEATKSVGAVATC